MIKLKKRMREKRGMSGIAWILISVGAMLMIYVLSDITLRTIMSQEMNGILDNAVSAGIAQIEEDQVSSGEIIIDPVRAERTVYEVVAVAYGLEVVEHNNGSTRFSFNEAGLKKSKLKEVPEIEFQVVPFTRDEIKAGVVKSSVPFSNGAKYKDTHNNTVIIQGKVTYAPLILQFLGDIELVRMSAAQAQILPSEGG